MAQTRKLSLKELEIISGGDGDSVNMQNVLQLTENLSIEQKQFLANTLCEKGMVIVGCDHTTRKIFATKRNPNALDYQIFPGLLYQDEPETSRKTLLFEKDINIRVGCGLYTIAYEY